VHAVPRGRPLVRRLTNAHVPTEKSLTGGLPFETLTVVRIPDYLFRGAQKRPLFIRPLIISPNDTAPYLAPVVSEIAGRQAI
jgi:hypothetical protein